MLLSLDPCYELLHCLKIVKAYPQSISWGYEFPFGILTHVMNYLLSSLRCQAIDNVKLEGHGPYHLTIAKLQVLLIRLCCNNILNLFKVVHLSHKKSVVPHIQ